jgi:UDP-GlcNAc:undecaprenyl-phosphate GlcNAc-1-phosphate transferase
VSQCICTIDDSRCQTEDLITVKPVTLFLMSFTASLVAVWAMRYIARWCRLTDRPNHTTGNLGIRAVLGAGVAVVGVTLIVPPLLTGSTSVLNRITAPIAAVCILGLIDDFITLPPWVKVVGQCGAVGLYLFQINLPMPALLIVAAFLVLSSNAWNVVDVMDGLLGSIGMTCFLGVWAVIALHGIDATNLHITSLAAAGALAGFLIWNWHPASILLGDAGSLALGMLYGVIVVECGLSDVKLGLVLLIPGVIPLFETSLLIIERTRKRIPFYHKTADHFALRLRSMGHSADRISVIVAIAGLALASAAVLIEVSSFRALVVIGTTGAIAAVLLVFYLWLVRTAPGGSEL